MEHTEQKTASTVEAFAGEIKRRLEALYPEYEVTVEKVLKNNGVNLTGLSILEQGHNTSTVLYMDGYFEMYQSGTDIEELSEDIAGLYHRNRRPSDFDTGSLMDWEKVKGQVCLRLVNQEKNRELLKTIPHRFYLDLAVVYYIPLPGFWGTTEYDACITVNKTLQAGLGVDEDALYEMAMRNTPILLGSRIVHMRDMLMSLWEELKDADMDMDMDMDMDREELLEEIPEMYVARNKSGIYGSALMLNRSLLKQFAAWCGGSFYILPCSVDELLFIPGITDDADDLSVVVQYVNRTALQKKDFLSDSVYRYCAEDGKVEIAR